MKVGDFVRYTSTGDALGTGIVLALDPNGGREPVAQVLWSGEVRFAPIRWIAFKYLEVIS